MKEAWYPTTEEALELHRLLIDRFGGAHGLRDGGLLESALARPRSGYYGFLSEQAGALLHSLTLNHCFLDGNKRMGFALTAAFVRMNGYRLEVSADDGEQFILQDVIAGGAGVPEIAAWLESHMRAV